LSTIALPDTLPRADLSGNRPAEAVDDGSASLTRYAKVVITVAD
jgi:hypothetical protein